MPAADARVDPGTPVTVAFAPPPSPSPPWVLLGALAIALVAAVLKVIQLIRSSIDNDTKVGSRRIKPRIPQPPPITYALHTGETTYAVTHDKSREGIGLSLALRGDPESRSVIKFK
jgi:hypothetical protein